MAHLHGDPYVREAATTGLLEDLQNTNLVGSLAPGQCLACLGPQSLRWWNRVERFWAAGELIRADDWAGSACRIDNRPRLN